MLEALIEGEQDPAAIAELVHPRMRPKIPALIEALTGRFGEHHRFMSRLFLDRIDAHTPTSPAWTPGSRRRWNPFGASGSC